jgi:hypothetical protein
MVVAEKELTALAAKHVAVVSEPSITVSPDGLRYLGSIVWKGISVAFQSEWRFSSEGGILKAALVSLRAGIIPAGPLKSMILGFITGMVNDQAVTATGDVVSVDINGLLAKRGLAVTVTLDSITCEEGALQFQCSEADILLA